MARILGMLPAALEAVRRGANATEFYKALKAIGEAPRQSEAYALFKHAAAIHANAGDEAFRPLTSVPTADEMTDWPTRSGTGVQQRVQLVIRDRTTGVQTTTWYSVVSPTGVTREQAIATAIAAADSNNERYKSDVIGAAHMSTYKLVPFTGA